MDDKVKKIVESEPKSSLSLRQWIVASIAGLYVFVGLPLWFKRTEIYRAPLPESFIETLQKNQNLDLVVKNSVYLTVVEKFFFPDLAQAVQIQVDEVLHKYTLDPELELIVDWNVTVIPEEAPSDEFYELYLDVADGEGIIIHDDAKRASLVYSLETLKKNDLPYFVTQTLLEHVFGPELELLRVKNQNKSINSIDYSPQVHLSFKLLTGDGDAVDWEIDQALQEYFSPLVESFAQFTNFTIDSEIKHFAELDVQPGQLININDLSTLLDFSAWDVTSNYYSYPTLNFILYYPSKDVSPLTLDFGIEENQENQEDKENEEDQEPEVNVPHAFVIPQYGCVAINTESLGANAVLTKESLKPVIEIFTSELFTLLGLPKNPKSPAIRLDATTKYSIFANLHKGIESLSSLLKLSKSLPNMSVPKTVLENVKKALSARQKVVEYVHKADWNSALHESTNFVKYSEEAFFDREMVQQTFFPQEHKIAVYLPLLGPLTIVCVMGVLRVLKEYKLYKTKKD